MLEANVFAALNVPARLVPPPASVSVAAQEYLAAAAAALAAPPVPYPAPDDTPGWRRLIAQRDARPVNVQLETRVVCRAEKLDGVPVYRCEPILSTPASPNVLLDLHGGAFVFGGGLQCREKGMLAAVAYGVTTYAVDYRMPPDHPFPAALDDCVRAYVAVGERHGAQRIVVQGISAGGNLAAALMLRLRAEGVPLPAGVILRTPEVDLTESGDSFQTNLGLDTTLVQRLMPANLLYANGRDLTEPLLSPLFGTFGPWHPPTVLTSGTRDLLLSNTVRMHWKLRQSGVEADLLVEEAGPHGGTKDTPESEATTRELRAAAERFWSRTPVV